MANRPPSAASSSSSTTKASIVDQPSRCAAWNRWFPTITWPVERCTATGQCCPNSRSDSITSATAPLLGFRSAGLSHATGTPAVAPRGQLRELVQPLLQRQLSLLRSIRPRPESDPCRGRRVRAAATGLIGSPLAFAAARASSSRPRAGALTPTPPTQ
jgi:hypothetical protein